MSDSKELNRYIQGLEQEVERLNQELLEASVASNMPGPEMSGDKTVLLQDEVARRTQNMKLAMEQAAQANKNKSAFLEKVSYDLRTPMNTILGMTDLVLDTELSLQQKRYLEMVRVSADNLLGVIDNILDFSKIELGKMEFEQNSFNMKESLERELYAHRLKATLKGIELRTVWGAGVPSLVECDEIRFLQIVSNLVDNGISYTNEGEVLLDISFKGFDSGGNSFIQVSVTDTGVGIQAAKQQVISESFKLGAVPPSGESDVNLLSLVISGHLVKLAGGEIGLESGGVEEGTTVWFRWPISIPAQHNTPTVDLERVSRSPGGYKSFEGVKILVAEDDPASRLLIETVLKPTGAVVTSVTNGKDAYDAFVANGFQFVLMDVQMPVMGGVECTGQIREYEEEHGGHAFIIALTALAMKGDRQRCLRAGMDDYLAKPIDKALLLDLLNRYLGCWALLVGESTEQLRYELLSAGWECTSVDSGKAAVYEASIFFYSLIVIDTSTSGYVETIKNVKRMSANTGKKQVVLGIDSDSSQAGARTELDAVLAKSFDEQELFRIMAKLFRS